MAAALFHLQDLFQFFGTFLGRNVPFMKQQPQCHTGADFCGLHAAPLLQNKKNTELADSRNGHPPGVLAHRSRSKRFGHLRSCQTKLCNPFHSIKLQTSHTQLNRKKTGVWSKYLGFLTTLFRGMAMAPCGLLYHLHPYGMLCGCY